MPTYVITGTTAVRVPYEVPTILVQASTGPAPTVDMIPQRDVRRRPGMLIVPRLDTEGTLVVESVEPEGFPAKCVLHVSIIIGDVNASDPVQVMVDPPIDVAGLRGPKELLRFTPGAADVEIRGEEPPPVLSPLGEAARMACRSVTGTAAAAASTVRVLVDASASMLPARADGGVRAAIDVLTGVCSAIGAGPLRASVVAGRVVDVPGEPARLGALVDETFESVEPLIGVRTPPPRAGEATIVVTDGSSAGWSDGSATLLLVLAPPSTGPVLAQQTTGPVAVLTPGDGHRTVGERLVADRAELTAFVSALVAPLTTGSAV